MLPWRVSSSGIVVKKIILGGRDVAGGYLSDPSGVLDRSFFLVLSCLTFSAARSHIELLTTINGARHLSELIRLTWYPRTVQGKYEYAADNNLTIHPAT